MKRFVVAIFYILLIVCSGATIVSAQKSRVANKKLSQKQLAAKAWSPFFSKFRTAINNRNEVALKQIISDDFTSDFFTYESDPNGERENRDSFLQRLSEQNNKDWKDLAKFIKTKPGELYDATVDAKLPRKAIMHGGGYYMQFSFIGGRWYLTDFYFADRI